MKFYIKIFSSIALFTLALYLLDINKMISILNGYSTINLIFAILVNIFMYILLSVRWHLIIKKQTEFLLIRNISIYLKGTYYSFFTPSNIGGDIYRYFKYKKIKKILLISLLILERLIGFLTYIIFYILSFVIIFFMGNKISLSHGYYLIPFLLSTSLLLIIITYLKFNFINNLYNKIIIKIINILNLKTKININYFNLRFSPEHDWNGIIVFSILSFILVVFGFQIISIGLGVKIPITHTILVLTLVEIIRFIPITVQGIGLREGSYALLMTHLGHNSEEVYLVALFAYLAISLAIVICGLISILIKTNYNRISKLF